jgi:hypothetical protein
MVTRKRTRGLDFSHVFLIVALATSVGGQTGTAASPKQFELHVRIMDSQTHRPLKGRKVQVDWWDTNGKWHPLIRHTAADGIVIFPIKEPIPPSIAVQDFWAYNCNTEFFSTQEVLDHGIITHWPHSGIKKADKFCTPNPDASQLQQRPGEITFFVHPLNRFEYAWYSLWK